MGPSIDPPYHAHACPHLDHLGELLALVRELVLVGQQPGAGAKQQQQQQRQRHRMTACENRATKL